MAKYQIRTGKPEIKCDCVKICKKERLVAWHFALSQVAARGEDWTDKRKQIGTKATKQERWWASAWVKHSTELGQRFFSHSLHHTLHPCTAAALVIFIGTEMSHKPFHINNRVTTTRGLCMQMLGGVYSGDWRCGAALICFALLTVLTCWALTTPLLPQQLLSQADWKTKRLWLNTLNCF